MRALKSHNITNDVIVAEDGVQAVQYLFGATGPPRPEELTAVVLLDPNLPLLVVVVAALVWNSLPLALTAGWVGAVTAAAALRTWWRLGLSRRTASPEEALRGVRLTVAGVGLAWGFGAAAAIPALGLDQAALILVVLAGIVAGASIDALIVPDSLRSESSDLEARARAGEIVRVEIERRRKDGRPIQVRLSAAAVKAAPEGGLVALYEDISDRKAAEQAMRAARELAERVARARSAFLANMSHEIRTPMNAVLGFVELVLDTELQVEQRRALELVRSSSEALLTILNDILDYSKIEAEHLELESIPFDLPKVVHATATLLAVRAREKHLELTVDVPPDVPHIMRGDPTRVRQVLMNLIGNAIKFTEQGEVGLGSEFSFTLRLPVERSAAAATPGRAVSLGGRRLLVVDDNETNRRILRDMLGAEGVAVHEAARADAGLTALRRAAAAGTPFDIAILDAQMPDQDGFELAAAVRADPDLAATKLLILTSAGQRGDGERCRQMGIQAYLTKPIARADLIEAVGTVLLEAPPAGAAPALITRHSIAESRHTLRILLAEDNLVNQQVATAMLVKRGHQVDVVGNGREAVDAIGAHDYDLVLMDIQMPEIDGFAATAAIRGAPAGRAR